jgi:hypothetical protein
VNGEIYGANNLWIGGNLLAQFDGANGFVRTYVGGLYLGCNGTNYVSVRTDGGLWADHAVRVGDVVSFQAGGNAFWIGDNVGGGPGFNFNSNCYLCYTRADGYLRYIVNGANQCYIGIGDAWFSGNIGAVGNIGAFSDRRLKSDLKPITAALDKIEKLTGYTFNRVGMEGRLTGLIAQDVLEVLPEAVFKSGEEETLSLNYGSMMGLIVEAIKELRQEINHLKGYA